MEMNTIKSHLEQMQNSIIALMIMLSVAMVTAGCSSSGFKLRDKIALPEAYNPVFISGLADNHLLYQQLKTSLQEVDITVVSSRASAASLLEISRFAEKKQAVGFGKNREIRQYLLSLNFDYELKSSVGNNVLLPRQSINLDKTQIYDSAYVLGKIDEEAIIRTTLRKDAARLVILRLRYGKNNTGTR